MPLAKNKKHEVAIENTLWIALLDCQPHAPELSTLIVLVAPMCDVSSRAAHAVRHVKCEALPLAQSQQSMCGNITYS